MNIELNDSDKIKVINSDDIYGIMLKILLREQKIDQNREHFWVIGLENNHRILFIELISLGTINATLVEPMEVFSLALQKRAAKIILCHNHPSGGLAPSKEDEDITDRLIQVGIIVNTPVIDHLIISDKGCLSFMNIGLFEELKKSIKYVPNYVLKQRIKQELIKLTEQKRSVEIARAFKKSGIEDEIIAQNTGLTLEEVKQL